MARARNIKPAFFENELLGELPPLDRLAFIAMWTIADFKGCFEYRPKRLKLKLLPYDDCDIEQIVGRLEVSGFLKRYSIAENDFIKIINFSVHQNPHIKEKSAGSKIPDIDLSISSGLDPNKNGTNHADSLNLIPDSLNLIPDSLKRNNYNGFDCVSVEELNIPHFDMSLVTDISNLEGVGNIEDIFENQQFERFWTNYPNKTSKEKTRKTWMECKPNLFDILKALEWQKKSNKWFVEGGRFIPSPTNYLLEARWEDEPPEEITF